MGVCSFDQIFVPVFKLVARSQLAANIRSPARIIMFRLASVGTCLQWRSQCQGHSIWKDRKTDLKPKLYIPSTKVTFIFRIHTHYLSWIDSFCLIGKSLSEALILASTNPQYDKRLFIELWVQYMKTTSSEHVVYINCFKCQYKKKNQFVYTACSELVVFMYILNW